MHEDDELLALSGIQHFAYCRRQWGLIHIEQVWKDNLLTTLGDLMHERAHNEELRERRGDLLIVRGLTVRSADLGIWGKCDVVEFHHDATGHPLFGEEGLWRAVPVEYKRGSQKAGNEDRLQLCAQAMCLEDMFACELERGYLFYGTTKSRETVEFTDGLRKAVRDAVAEMHRLYVRRHVPNVRQGAKCRSCSLAELCIPKAINKRVSTYVEAMLGGDCR